MGEPAGNQTPNTPDVSETRLREMKVDELRDEAREAGVSGASDMRKEDLVQAVARDGGALGARTPALTPRRAAPAARA